MSVRVMKTPTVSDLERLNHLRVAYAVADEHMEDVLIVWVPQSGMSYQENLPYIVQSSVANAYEVKNGERIQWRVKV